MTATAASLRNYSLEEYFELEYQSSEKQEYLDGKIKKMTYTAKPHGKIAHNLDRMIGNCLADRELEIYAGDRMLYIPDCNKVYYPDLMVLPVEVETFSYRGKMEVDLYPVALIEILCDSTENQDYEQKWHCYQKINTLLEYMLVSQKYPFVEIFRRTSDQSAWIYSAADQETASIEFVGCNMTVKDIYKRVKFPPATTQSDELIS